MNVFTVSGNLGRDAEVKTVGQHTVTSFSIAAKAGFGDKAKPFWVNCNAWNKDKLAPFLTKGSKVTVSGELSTREYDKRDGSKGFSLELRVNDVDLPPKMQDSSSSPNQDAANTSVEEVPF